MGLENEPPPPPIGASGKSGAFCLGTLHVGVRALRFSTKWGRGATILEFIGCDGWEAMIDYALICGDRFPYLSGSKTLNVNTESWGCWICIGVAVMCPRVRVRSGIRPPIPMDDRVRGIRITGLSRWAGDMALKLFIFLDWDWDWAEFTTGGIAR